MIRWMTIAALGVGLFLAAGTGAADDKAEAKKHFKAGVALFKAEKFDGAAVEFDESARLYKTKGALFNLANCYKALSRYAEALATLRLLEGEFKGALGEEMLDAVKQVKDEIDSITGELRVKVNRDGAEIYMDDELVGRSPLPGPLLLGPGYHVVRVELKGMETYSRKVKLVSGANLKIEVNFKPGKTTPGGVLLRESVTQPEPEPEPEPVDEEGKRSPLLLVLGIGGTAIAIGLGVVAGVYWNKTSAAADDYDKYLDSYGGLDPGSSSYDAEEERIFGKMKDARDDVAANNRLFVGFTVGASVMAAASVVFCVMYAKSDGEGEESPAKPVAFYPALGGLALTFQ